MLHLQTYCRIHQTIDTKQLAQKLNMDLESAEKWITNLILTSRLNAKIDSKAGAVIMGTQVFGSGAGTGAGRVWAWSAGLSLSLKERLK